VAPSLVHTVNLMDERVDGQLGLVTLYEGSRQLIECVIYPLHDHGMRMLI
jgi:hypothetical protein